MVNLALIEDIQSAVKSKKAILGFNKSLEYIRNNSPSLVVISNNIQEERKNEIEHDIKVSGTKLEIFEGDSKELGIICGKPFPVSILVIK